MTPSDIIDHFERAWRDNDALSTTAQLDRYVLWMSEHWKALAAHDREVLLSIGATVFREWVGGAGPAASPFAQREDASRQRESGNVVAL